MDQFNSMARRAVAAACSRNSDCQLSDTLTQVRILAETVNCQVHPQWKASKVLLLALLKVPEHIMYLHVHQRYSKHTLEM